MRTLLAALLLAPQEQVDKADAPKRAAFAVDAITVRARVTRAPDAKAVRLQWRRGGEGLGGDVVRGDWGEDLELNAWSRALSLKDLVGRGGGWQYLTVVVAPAAAKKAAALTDTAVEFEFAEGGKPFKAFVEPSPKGSTVGLAVPLGAANREEFAAQLAGLSTYARARRERLERLFPEPAAMPQKFGLIGHLGGYGEGAAAGKGGGAGYGVRHCNPEILADECRTQKRLGINGLVGHVKLADLAGFGDAFRRVYWGGPGSGNPMAFFQRGGKNAEPVDGCPFDPRLKAFVEERVKEAVTEHQAVKARESWALWDDEMGVYAKEHIAGCKGCAAAFREYLQGLRLEASAFGKASWDEVLPFPIWEGKGHAAPPRDPSDALRYYYTYRLMTHATAQVYPRAARAFREAGILLYAMQGPTPSWAGASLDWHEFYDHKANTAFVFETSNRDPRSWQWESYLSDIGRGIAARHGMPIGCLVKPHRGAPEQRMLSVVARGATVLEWYTYGPDYAKGDSFSQRPDLLERVARAGRFLGKAEEYLYGARWAAAPEVAFCSPRSSEIWGRAGTDDAASWEDAKWVYLALRHAHVPVDVVSEQQLAEGNFARYKAIYVVGPTLRRDAAEQLKAWVRAGGLLWTGVLGLSRDEALRPLDLLPGDRKAESWGTVQRYKATALQPITGAAGKALSWEGAEFAPAVGREVLPGDAAARRVPLGRGEIFHTAVYAGLSYSAKVRRADFDMRADFDPAWRRLVAGPALARAARPVVPSDPLVEAVLLEKDGRRSVALMNWAYKGRELQPVENLRVELPEGVTSVRSVVHGPLPREGRAAVVPRMMEIDLLVLE
jgi:hypothetical protein